jgi:Tfp pilus assembly protein PilN
VRPVNLLPSEDRRGSAAPSRAGNLAYALVAVLAIAVAGVAATTLLGKSVKDKEAELAALEREEAELTARAASLSSFASFEQLKEDRVATVTSLAESRFDWERVMRELSLVLPNRVWLVNVTGTVSPEVQVQDGAGIGLRSEVPGPALELDGCARSQRDVARLIASIEDIGGVTRVTVAQSEKPGSDVAAAGGSEDDVADDCRTRSYVTQFQLVAAFDAVAVEAASPQAPAPETATTTETGSAPPPDDGGVGAAEAQQEAEAGDVNESGERVENAAEIAAGGGE